MLKKTEQTSSTWGRKALAVALVGVAGVLVLALLVDVGSEGRGLGGNSDYYRAELAKLPSVDPQTVTAREFELRYKLGYHLAQEGALEEAYRSLDEALEVARKEAAAAYCQMGAVRMDQARYEEALEHFEAAIEHNPSLRDAYQNKAVTLRWMGEYDASIAACRDTLSVFPGFARAYSSKGWALEKMERHEEAIRAQIEAIRLAPDWEFPKLRVARGMESLDDFEKKAALLDRLMDVDGCRSSLTEAALRTCLFGKAV